MKRHVSEKLLGLLVMLLFVTSCNMFDADHKTPTAPLVPEPQDLATSPESPAIGGEQESNKQEEPGSGVAGELDDTFELSNALYSGTGFVYPVDTKTTGGYYGWLSYASGSGYHLGVDLKISAGSRVYAIADGVVIGITSNYYPNGGGALWIKHRTSNGAYFVATYGHILATKANGATVKAGEQVGAISNCWVGGSNLPHIHFSIRPNATNVEWKAYTWSLSNLYGNVNPLNFLEANRPLNGGGSSCPECIKYDNKDPIAMGCAGDARTVSSTNIYSSGVRVGLVELRWSNACGTNWGRVTRYDGRNREAMIISVQRTNPAKTVSGSLAGYSQIYSYMVYGRNIPARACATVRGVTACTGWI